MLPQRIPTGTETVRQIWINQRMGEPSSTFTETYAGADQSVRPLFYSQTANDDNLSHHSTSHSLPNHTTNSMYIALYEVISLNA